MKLDEKYYKGIACFLIILLCGAVYLFMSQKDIGSDPMLLSSMDEISSMDEVPLAEETEETQQERIYIHICGAVKKPGVYEFMEEPRLIEVVKKAGGFTKKAAADSINQAQIVTDGSQIMIENKKQVKKDAKEKAGSEKEQSPKESLVNINTAAKEELMTLTGIGEAKAAMIIQYREENGSFKAKEDIMNISGIKEGVYNKIKDQIAV